MHRAEPVPGRSVHRTERWLREADVPLVLVGNTVWRIKRRPVWNVVGGGSAALSVVAAGQVIEVRCLAQEVRPPEITTNPLPGVRYRGPSLLKPALEQKWAGPNAARAGSRPILPAARLALALKGGVENAGTSKIEKFHRCTGRLSATQPGLIAVSTPYIR
jgi:hypothetical protein